MIAARDELERQERAWVASVDDGLVSRLRGALIALESLMLGHTQGSEGAPKLFATVTEDVRRLGEASERRLPK